MIGNNIHYIRKLRGLTLSELAERAKISKSYLSNMERNLNKNPSLQIIKKVASALDIDFRTLLGATTINKHMPEHEWIDFVNELKRSGVEKEQLHEYKQVIEFVKWQNAKVNGKR
jgi:XRE family transcriptional regulator of biofilm formation